MSVWDRSRPGRDQRQLDRPPLIRHSARVTTRKDWKRLGKYVQAARVDAGHKTQGQFVQAITDRTGSSMTVRTIGNLERGHSVAAATLAAVELTLGWRPGSCDAILDGGEPTIVDKNEPQESDTELRRSLRVLRRALGRERFFQLIDEMSQPPTDAGSSQAEGTS